MKTEKLIERLETLSHVTADKSDNHTVRLIYKPTQSADYPKTLLVFPIDAKDVFDFVNYPTTIRQCLTSGQREYLWFELSQYLKTPISERAAETKYTVQVIADNQYSFLNIDPQHGDLHFSDCDKGVCKQYKFSRSEIADLKSRDDLAIDWDKAIIKLAEDD